MATIARRNIIVDFEVNSKKAQKQLNDVGKAATGLQSTLQTAAGTFAGIAAFDIASRLVTGLNDAAKSAVGLAISAEQTQVAFETFLGSAGKARQVLEELNQFSELTPFEPEQVIRAGQSLLAFGIEADKLTDTLKFLGDVSAGTGTDFNELAEIFGKAKVQGRLFAEDINQLTGRGIPIISEFAKQFGVAESQVKKLVESGKIGFPELERAFIDLTSEGGKFFDLTAKQSQTIAGRISTLTGNFNAFLREIGERFLPIIGDAVDAVSRLVGTLREFVEVPLSDELEEQRIAFRALTLELNDTNTSEERRLQIIQQLQKEYPAFLSNIDAEKVSNEELAPALEQINEALVDRILLQRQIEREEQAAERVADLREREIELISNVREEQARLLDIFEQLGVVIPTQNTSLKERNELLQEAFIRAKETGNTTIALALAASELSRNNSELLKVEQDLTDARGDLAEEGDKLRAQLAVSVDSVEKLSQAEQENTEVVNQNTKAVEDNEKARKQLAKFNEFVRKEALRLRREAQQATKEGIESDQQAEKDRQERFEREKGRREFEIQQQINDIQENITAVKERNLEELQEAELTAERREEIAKSTALRIARLELDIIQAQLDNQFLTNEERISLEQQLADKRIQIATQANEQISGSNEETETKTLESIKTIIDANKQLADSIINSAKEVTQQRIDQLDRQIDAQRQAVENAALLAERGSAELLDTEERRLEELTNARRRAAEQFETIARIEVVANQALAVSQGIVAVTKAFRDGTLIEGIATSIALAATVASAIFALNNAFTNVPAFAEGTEYFDGVGGPKSDSNLARISRGERIVPADKNQKYFDTLNEFQNGSPMADYLHGIAQGNIPHVALDRQKDGGSNKQLIKEMESVKNAINKLDISVRMDKNGFAASISQYIDDRNRIRKKLRE